jgi:hypothetical protein
MLDQIGIVLILFILWIGVRYWGARWLWARVNSGQLSYDTGQALNAGMYALLPLLVLPWATSPTDVAVVVGLSIGLFVFEFMLGRLYRWFIRRNP